VDAEPARVAPVEVALLAEDLLDARVVPVLVVAEVDRAEVVVPVVAPAGQRAGLLADVLLGVAASVGADREQLHHLAPVVLVRRVLLVVDPGEPEQHRGVARHLGQEARERSERVLPEELVLADHQARRVDALARGREPVVPDERHPLGEGLRRPHHPVEPPELVVAPGVERGERVAVVVVRLRPAQALPAGVRQRMDGAVEPELRKALGFARARSEARAPEQALGLRLAERSTVNRRHPAIIGGEGDGPLMPVRVRARAARRRPPR